MSFRSKTIIKLSAAAGLAVVAVATAISKIHHLTATGEEGLQVWFYDQSEAVLYTVPRGTVPPHEGVGGDKNDGVRAVVVAGRDECSDRSKRRIAYLETYTPEHKQLVEGIRAARAEGRAYGRPIPSAGSGFYEKNTLVRRVDDPKWFDMTTVEARQIVSQWRNERSPEGNTLDICMP